MTNNGVKRSEFLFLYDLAWGNANGDPLDSNKPRRDSESGRNIVTDVRLKRTIRDELYARGHEILIRDTYQDDGSLSTSKHRAKDFMPSTPKKAKGKEDEKLSQEVLKGLKDNVLSQCIDVRLFGCTLPYDNGGVIFTGPVQFKMGYSLHPVNLELIKGTGAFAGGDEKEHRTFRQEYVVPYSLIQFYGVLNERAANDTRLTEDDVRLMMDCMWSGTRNLVSRTKAGQTPRLLLRVVYKEPLFFIGELDKYVTLSSERPGESIRDISDAILILSSLIQVLERNKEFIEKVEIKVDERANVDTDIIKTLKDIGINVVVLSLMGA